MELIWTGVDKSAALNEGPAVIPADDDAHAFPFGVVVGNEPGVLTQVWCVQKPNLFAVLEGSLVVR